MFQLHWSPAAFHPVYQRYRLIALAVYLTVLLAGIVDWLYGGIGSSALWRLPEALRFYSFLVAMFLLIVIELMGVGHLSFEHTNNAYSMRFFPFALRLLFLLSVFLLTDLSYTRILFLLIVLYSYLALGQWFSYAIVVIGIVALFSLSFADPVLMGFAPNPELLPRQEGPAPSRLPPPPPPPPRPTLAGLIDGSMAALITIFFTLLLARTMAQALQQQQKLEDLNASLEASHTQLKHYASQVAELATTEERNRLARDIHDSLGHHLAAINIQLLKAHAYRERDPERAAEAVQLAQHSVQDALKDVRESVSSLREDSDSFSFEQALESLVKRMQHSDLDIKLEQTGESSHYGKLTLMTLYRVIQEGLTNIHKHAEASSVSIHIAFGKDAATVALTDNGHGFDVAAWEAASAGRASFGLQGLRERLALLGGSLCIQSQPMQTRLNASLPKLLSATYV